MRAAQNCIGVRRISIEEHWSFRCLMASSRHVSSSLPSAKAAAVGDVNNSDDTTRVSSSGAADEAPSPNVDVLSRILRFFSPRRVSHAVYQRLTTSARSRSLLRDAVRPRRLAEMERSNVHKVNDWFMAAGHSGAHLDTQDGRTLEKGLAFQFMLPYVFAFWVAVIVVHFYASPRRLETKEAMIAHLQRDLEHQQERLQRDEEVFKELMLVAKLDDEA